MDSLNYHDSKYHSDDYSAIHTIADVYFMATILVVYRIQWAKHNAYS